jgi:hypothetical protein
LLLALAQAQLRRHNRTDRHGPNISHSCGRNKVWGALLFG